MPGCGIARRWTPAETVAVARMADRTSPTRPSCARATLLGSPTLPSNDDGERTCLAYRSI